MSYPHWKQGSYHQPATFSTSLAMKNIKNSVGMSNCYCWPQYLPDGGVWWHLVKPWTSSIGKWAQYCTGAPPQPSKWPAKLVHFSLLFYLLSSQRSPGQYGESRCLDMLHWVMHTAKPLVHPQGHQNGPQQRYIWYHWQYRHCNKLSYLTY